MVFKETTYRVLRSIGSVFNVIFCNNLMRTYFKSSSLSTLFNLSNIVNHREQCPLEQHSEKLPKSGKLETFLLGSTLVLFFISFMQIHIIRKEKQAFEEFRTCVSIKGQFSDKDKFSATTHIHCFKEVENFSGRFHFKEKGIWASHTLLSEDSSEF